MTLRKLFSGTLALSALMLLAMDASARSISTADLGGADAELRESQPVTARGTGSEIASRINSASRNSLIYLKFGVGDVNAGELANDITVQTHIRNSNLSNGRIQDAINGTIGPNAGFDYYVLDPTLANANWDEATITPTSAAADGIGYSFDGNFDTKGSGAPFAPTAGLTYLGTQRFRDLVDPENNLPIGEAFDRTFPAGSDLHTAIAAAQGTAHQTVTVVMSVNHETTSLNSNWLNFNYLFSPKEWVADQGLPSGWAPSLELIPEPASIALMGIGGIALAGMRKRS